jgi:hypothetical protein
MDTQRCGALSLNRVRCRPQDPCTPDTAQLLVASGQPPRTRVRCSCRRAEQAAPTVDRWAGLGPLRWAAAARRRAAPPPRAAVAPASLAPASLASCVRARADMNGYAGSSSPAVKRLAAELREMHRKPALNYTAEPLEVCAHARPQSRPSAEAGRTPHTRVLAGRAVRVALHYRRAARHAV